MNGMNLDALYVLKQPVTLRTSHGRKSFLDNILADVIEKEERNKLYIGLSFVSRIFLECIN